MQSLQAEALQRNASGVTSPREAARVAGLGIEALRSEVPPE
jgi:hypothetical protein